MVWLQERPNETTREWSGVQKFDGRGATARGAQALASFHTRWYNMERSAVVRWCTVQ